MPVAFLFVASLAMFSTAQAVTIAPSEATSEDTFVYEGFPDDNFDIGNAGPTFGRILGVGVTNSGHTTETLLKFDLSGVGLLSGQVTAATLTLRSQSTPFGANPAPANPVLVDLYANAAAFSETGMTWNTARPLGSLYASTSVNDINTLFNWDVTQLVKDWLDGTIPNHGVLLKGNAAVPVGPTYAVATFGSSSTILGFVPTLTVVPEPSSVVLALMGLGATLIVARKRLARRVRSANQFS
jgi:hypothetical protein